jgi:hypothetical protein
MPKAKDVVNNPPHYTRGTMECLEAIEGLDLTFHQGQVLKYLVRYKHKHTSNRLQIRDLEKAMFYLKRLIEIESSEA